MRKTIVPTFIDSNVIANWIIVSSGLKTKKDISEREVEELFAELSIPVANSYYLLEKIKNENIEKFGFYTSHIAYSEVFSVIGDEYRSRLLSQKGVPIRYWTNMINEIVLPEKYIEQIYEEINNFEKIFFDSKKFGWALDIYNPDIGFFIFNCKCNTHDAIILSGALMEKCKYFITEDERLRSRLKKMKYNKIKLLSSNDYLRDVFT